MRSILALSAAGLAALAAVTSDVAGQADVVIFFVVLVVGAAFVAALAAGPWTSPARRLARTLAVAWIAAAVWIAVLLGWAQALCACSSPEPAAPEPSIGGVPLTAIHLAATYFGGALIAVAAFSGRVGVRGGARR